MRVVKKSRGRVKKEGGRRLRGDDIVKKNNRRGRGKKEAM